MLVKHLVISGRVQGVFFRATTQEQAMRLGVHGWVKNNTDGTVEAHLEGEDEAVNALVDWCRHGPEMAEVTDIKITDCKAEHCTMFEVLR